MQDSLLDFLYKIISIGSPTCRILYETSSIKEFLLGLYANVLVYPVLAVLNTGFSIRRSLKRNLCWKSYLQDSLLHLLSNGILFGAPHARFSIRRPLRRNLYWESYMQDSL